MDDERELPTVEQLCAFCDDERRRLLRFARNARRLAWYCSAMTVLNLGLMFVARWWWINAACAVLMFALACWNLAHARRWQRFAAILSLVADELRYVSRDSDQ